MQAEATVHLHTPDVSYQNIMKSAMATGGKKHRLTPPVGRQSGHNGRRAMSAICCEQAALITYVVNTESACRTETVAHYVAPTCHASIAESFENALCSPEVLIGDQRKFDRSSGDCVASVIVVHTVVSFVRDGLTLSLSCFSSRRRSSVRNRSKLFGLARLGSCKLAASRFPVHKLRSFLNLPFRVVIAANGSTRVHELSRIGFFETIAAKQIGLSASHSSRRPVDCRIRIQLGQSPRLALAIFN